jgi:O-antigen/teichoic acid export membrane protein
MKTAAQHSAERVPSIRQTGINILVMWISRLLAILAPLITTPIITKYYGIEKLGVWLLIVQYTSFLQLLDLGLNTSLGRFLARYGALGDKERMSRYLSTCFLFLCGIGALVVLLSPLVALGFYSSFDFKPVMRQDVIWAVILVSATIGLGMPFRTGTGLLFSRHYFDRIALWEGVSLLVRLSLTIAIFLYIPGLGLVVLGMVVFVPNLIQNLVLFIEGMRHNSGLKVSVSRITGNYAAEMFSLSASSIVITLATVVLLQGAGFLVGKKLGLESVVLLTLPLQVLNGIMSFINIPLISPVASQLDAASEKPRLYQIYKTTANYTLSITLIMFILLHFVSFSLFRLWLGRTNMFSMEQFHVMANVLDIVLAGYCMCVVSIHGRYLLNAVGKHWWASLSELMSSGIGILSGLALMVYTRAGVSGMAVGISVAFAIRGLIAIPNICTRYLGVNYLGFMKDLIGKPLLIAAVALVATELVPVGIGSELVSSIFKAGIASSLWVMGSWVLVVEPVHKVRIKSMIVNLRT